MSGSRLVTQNMLLGLDSGWMMGRGAARRKTTEKSHSDSLTRSKRIWTKSSLRLLTVNTDCVHMNCTGSLALWGKQAEMQQVKVRMSLAHGLLCRVTMTQLSRCRTQFGLHESISDSQVVSGDGLSVDHPQQSELGRQRVHDHRQVSLPNLRRQTERPHCVLLPEEIWTQP